MEYRTFVPGIDDAAVLKLRANVWGAGHPHTAPAFMRWQLGNAPAGAGSGIIMLDGQDAMGFAGLLPRQMAIDGVPRTAAQCVDYMVHTEARSGAGSFRIMSLWAQLACEKGYDFGIGFPNASSRQIVTRPRLGWTEAFWPEQMVRPLSGKAVPDSLARRIPARLARYGVGALAALAHARAGMRTRDQPGGEPCQIERFDPRFDLLWQSARAKAFSGIRRDSAFLNWRFAEQPAYTYLRIGWIHRGEVLGYVIASPRDVLGMPSMLVVDLLTAPGAVGVAEALLDEVAARARDSGIHLLASVAIERSTLLATYARAGFVKVPRRMNPKPLVMTTHDLGKRNPLPAIVPGWHFTWSDTDVV